MPFGLNNAPQLYQRLIDNARYGFLLIPPASDGQAVVKDVFEGGIPADPSKPSILGRRSYIDDIIIPASKWDELCSKVNRFMNACDQWNLSISVPKSAWGKRAVEQLGHVISPEGIATKPKDLTGIRDLPFPTTLKALQSFLGSLKYNDRFIQNFAVHAAILYELRDRDLSTDVHITRTLEEIEHIKRAKVAFQVLKDQIAVAPVLRHFAPDSEPVIITDACEWAVALTLVQDHEGIYMPVRFCSRVLKAHELRYHPAEKQILPLLRMLDQCHTMLVGRKITTVTRTSTLSWILKTNAFQVRLGQWSALLSPWEMTFVKAEKGEDEILGILAASIAPRSVTDAALEQIRQTKTAQQHNAPLIPRRVPGATIFVVAFDLSAKPKRASGGFAGILWRLDGWLLKDARSAFVEEATVNEAKYRGAFLELELAVARGVKHVILCGDSNLVIRQLRGDMACITPTLTVLKMRVEQLFYRFSSIQFLHMKARV